MSVQNVRGVVAIEAEALLDHERRPPARTAAPAAPARARGRRRRRARSATSRPRPSARVQRVEPAEAAGEPEAEQQRQVERRREQAEAGARAGVALGLPVALGVVEVAERGRPSGSRARRFRAFAATSRPYSTRSAVRMTTVQGFMASDPVYTNRVSRLIGIATAGILAILGLLHVYWAAGGAGEATWRFPSATAGRVPAVAAATVVVAMLLFSAALVLFGRMGLWGAGLPRWPFLSAPGSWWRSSSAASSATSTGSASSSG